MKNCSKIYVKLRALKTNAIHKLQYNLYLDKCVENIIKYSNRHKNFNDTSADQLEHIVENHSTSRIAQSVGGGLWAPWV